MNIMIPIIPPIRVNQANNSADTGGGPIDLIALDGYITLSQNLAMCSMSPIYQSPILVAS